MRPPTALDETAVRPVSRHEPGDHEGRGRREPVPRRKTRKDGRYYGIAFIYSQNDRVGKNFDKSGAKGDISGSRVVSIADVERATGIPLFTEFAEDIQKDFKSQKDLSGWVENDCSKRLCGGAREQNEE